VVKKRDLGADEQALWDEVTRHVRRLKAQKIKNKPRVSTVGRSATEPTAIAEPVSARSPAKSTPRVPTGFGIDGATAERLRRGKVEPDSRLDLHGLTQTQAHTRLLAYVRRARERGERCLLVITGKGAPAAHTRDDLRPFSMPERPKAGVLRVLVPRWLAEVEMLPFVVGVQSAHRRHGGAGALYVYLRRQRA